MLLVSICACFEHGCIKLLLLGHAFAIIVAPPAAGFEEWTETENMHMVHLTYPTTIQNMLLHWI